ncbi:cytosolic Fe-S cluster assembly factor NUBP1 isoform X1 [Gopherus flavomarginatus]|uniref:cytosolic Fe-S cluster assembly factor NUBP1 isoform X1 n=1 Tax=Gopherus flavomarginatus TaxID=286002 RepID=UPI0021CBD6A7|nr:cytosolic Fe-S cluster assembly factor NUBP1 isoform X1 [Gopherus flavomarginatus]
MSVVLLLSGPDDAVIWKGPQKMGKVVIKANLFCLKYLSPQLLHLTGISSKGFKNIVAYTTHKKNYLTKEWNKCAVNYRKATIVS